MGKYPFNQTGVDLWLKHLYSLNLEAQMNEQEGILSSFSDWLSSRFGLSPEQIDYAYGLNDNLTDNLKRELVFAINNHFPIKLIKETSAQETKAMGDSVKVTEYEARHKQSGRGTSTEEVDIFIRDEIQVSDGDLTIRIFYDRS